MRRQIATADSFRFANSDERKFWRDAVLVVLRDCLNLTQGKAGPGCTQLAVEIADDATKALRLRSTK